LFSKAIVRKPGKSMIHGLTSAQLGKPCYEKALEQHQSYINALRECDLEVIVLEADEDYPDSTFVEDTALLTPHCAIIMNPGAPSRRGEIFKILSEHKFNVKETTNHEKIDLHFFIVHFSNFPSFCTNVARRLGAH